MRSHIQSVVTFQKSWSLAFTGAGARPQSSGFVQPHLYGTVFWEEKQLPTPSMEMKLAFKALLLIAA